MALNDNERLQEFFILIGDRLAPVKRVWWYILAAAVVLVIPGYFLAQTVFVQALYAQYHAPGIVYTTPEKEPIQILDKKILSLPGNTYYGYVKVRNTNHEWGVASQEYTADFKTTGGTTVNTFHMSTFILPASEKLIVLPRFTSANPPTNLQFTLAETHFIHRPDLNVNDDIQRTSLANNPDGLVVSSAYVNKSAFTIKQVDVPVVVYNSQNEIVAVNFTYINDVKSSETRTFQYTWPTAVAGAIRAEVNPEVNIFDRNIFSVEPGVSPFTSSDRPQ